jgi:hypothetical protein
MRNRPTINSQCVVRPSFSLCVLIAAVVLVTAPAVSSFAQATVGKFHFEEPFSDTITNFPCAEGVPVLMTGTVTTDGHFTDAGNHFTVHGTNTIHYRVDLEDGSYALGQVIDRFSFAINFNRPRNVVSSTQKERATLYGANSQTLGTMTVHVTHHVTYSDLNGNGEPDPGEITTEADLFKVTCP